MSTERRIVRNGAWLALGPLALNILGLAATAYITRQIGASEFGRFNLGLAFIAMFMPLANLGLRNLANRHVSRHRENAREYLGRVMTLRLVLALVVAAVATLSAPLCGSGELRAAVAIMAVGMIFSNLNMVLIDAFQAFEEARPSSIGLFVGGCVLTVASILVIHAGGGIRELALAYALGPLSTFVVLWIWSRRREFHPHPIWDPSVFGPLLRAGLPFFGILLLEVVSSRVDILVMARLLGERNLGCYAAAMGMVERAMYLIDGIATALFPAVAQLGARDSRAAQELLRKSALWCLAISLPLAILATVFSSHAIGIIFGPQYAQAAPILALGIWRIPALSLSVITGQALFAAGRQDLELKTGAIAMLVALLLVYPLAYTFGPFGGAVVLTVRYLLEFALRFRALARAFPRLWPWRQLGHVTTALALMSVPLAFTLPLGPDLASLTLAPLAILIYLASLDALRVVSLQPILQRLAKGG